MRLSVNSVAAILLLALSLSGCAMSLAGSARIYEEKGDYSRAIIYYEKLAELESQEAKRLDIYMRLARIYARMGHFKVAQAKFECAMAIVSELPDEPIREVLPFSGRRVRGSRNELDAEFCLALSALEKGNYKRCIVFLENMLLTEDKGILNSSHLERAGINPVPAATREGDFPHIHYYLSIAYKNQSKNYFLGRSLSAVQDLTKPTSEFRDAITLINRGRELAKQGDTEEAERKFRLALGQVPEGGPAEHGYEKALLLLKEGRFAESIPLLLEMSETADVNYYLGIAYQAQARASAQIAVQWMEAEKKEETREDMLILYEDAIQAVTSDL